MCAPLIHFVFSSHARTPVCVCVYNVTCWLFTLCQCALLCAWANECMNKRERTHAIFTVVFRILNSSLSQFFFSFYSSSSLPSWFMLAQNAKCKIATRTYLPHTYRELVDSHVTLKKASSSSSSTYTYSELMCAHDTHNGHIVIFILHLFFAENNCKYFKLRIK